MKRSKFPILLCLSLTLGLSGLSAESEAKGRVSKQQKVSQHNKVKQAKLKRRANRRAKPQRRLATLKLTKTRLANKSAKNTKATAADRTAINAINRGNIASLMTMVKGKPVLNFGKYSKAARLQLRTALNDGPQSRYTIEFGTIPGAERVEIAKASFRGHDRNPLTKEAWAKAAGANSVSVKLNLIEFGTGKSKVSYSNTMAGTIRTRFSKGKEINESARWNTKNDTWRTKVL